MLVGGTDGWVSQVGQEGRSGRSDLLGPVHVNIDSSNLGFPNISINSTQNIQKLDLDIKPLD